MSVSPLFGPHGVLAVVSAVVPAPFSSLRIKFPSSFRSEVQVPVVHVLRLRGQFVVAHASFWW